MIHVILSKTGHYKAELRETKKGIEVTIWHNVGMWKRAHRDVLDCSLHVARDRVYDMLWNLTPEIGAFGVQRF